VVLYNMSVAGVRVVEFGPIKRDDSNPPLNGDSDNVFDISMTDKRRFLTSSGFPS